MLTNETQGTSRAAVIFLATVVFPDAEAPQIPMTKASDCICPSSSYQGGRPAV